MSLERGIVRNSVLYFICGDDLEVAIVGILMEDGNNTSLTFFDGCDGDLSLFKQDDLKSSKLNSGNACNPESGLKMCTLKIIEEKIKIMNEFFYEN